MSFAPTHNTTLFNTRIDLYRFYRNLHLKAWHHQQAVPSHNHVNASPVASVVTGSLDNLDEDSVLPHTQAFKPKSRFAPIVSNPCLIAFTKKMDCDIAKLFNDTPNAFSGSKHNLTHNERTALNELSRNQDIIIRPADKGGAIVVLSKEQYVTEAKRQLDSKYYVKLSCSPLPEMKRQFTTMLDEALAANWIDQSLHKYLLIEQPNLASLNLLPKIHKEPLANGGIPHRPIISGIGTISEHASKYIDSFIQPYVRRLPSFIEDTTDVLNSIANLPNLTSHYLVTCDVTSLYTNIEHGDGLEALEHCWSDRGEASPPTSFLLNLTKWILHNNVFMFSDNIYKQVIGVPMGSCFAPTYSINYLGYWEERFILNPINPWFNCITYYGRYIDDLLFIFDGSETQLKDFHGYLNSLNANIQLTMEYSQETINFLDLTIYKDDTGKLHTTIYRKEMARNTLLMANSFHPTHLIENIPFGQFQRLRRICDNDDVFTQQAGAMAKRFSDRAYKPHVISGALAKANSLSRSDLLKKKRRKSTSQQRPYFVTQYSTAANHIKRIIKDNWSIIDSDPTLRGIFPEPPLVSFKRAPTIKDKVVRSHFPPEKKETWLKRPIGMFKCMHCPHCINVLPTKTFTDFKTQRVYTIKDHISCSSDHVIYRLTCSCPGIFYIGRTKRRLKDRLAEHKYAIRTKNFDYPIARHFAQAHNSSDSDLRIVGIEHIRPLLRGGDRLRKLNQREAYWIHELDSLNLPGINDSIELMCFL